MSLQSIVKSLLKLEAIPQETIKAFADQVQSTDQIHTARFKVEDFNHDDLDRLSRFLDLLLVDLYGDNKLCEHRLDYPSGYLGSYYIEVILHKEKDAADVTTLYMKYKSQKEPFEEEFEVFKPSDMVYTDLGTESANAKLSEFLQLEALGVRYRNYGYIQVGDGSEPLVTTFMRLNNAIHELSAAFPHLKLTVLPFRSSVFNRNLVASYNIKWVDRGHLEFELSFPRLNEIVDSMGLRK